MEPARTACCERLSERAQTAQRELEADLDVVRQHRGVGPFGLADLEVQALDRE